MKTYLVGGSVRDELLGLPVQDHDYVVVGASPEDMERLGYRPVGKDFPVFNQTNRYVSTHRTENIARHKIEYLPAASHIAGRSARFGFDDQFDVVTKPAILSIRSMSPIWNRYCDVSPAFSGRPGTISDSVLPRDSALLAPKHWH